ncbi:hypothetical protein ACIQ2D_07700 [Lysinibacillus sp. NPDC097287]|uniref:hypothetical protein n=1 Tax=Lysinibacillus sp. NPDC097287 TaxID=3364144 RepID=UPI00381CC083
MKKTLFLTVIGVVFLVLTACSNGDRQDGNSKVKSITIQEMISFKETKRNSKKKISNVDDVKKVVDAFSNAFQEPGIVDMDDPEFKVKIERERYYLWFSDDGRSATIMNVDDTNTVYSMSSTEGIHKIFHAKLE